MKSIYKIFLALIVIGSISCKKKKEIILDSPISNNELNIIWKYPFPDSLIAYHGLYPILFENSIIASYQPIINTDYIRPSPQQVKGPYKNYTNNEKLFACSNQDNYSINMISGETNWATNKEEGNPRTSLWNDLLFHTETFGEAPYGDSSNLLMRNITSGIWQKVFTVVKTDQFEVNLETPGAYLHSNGDTLLIFQNRQVEIAPPYPERVDLYCYNLSQDSITWFKSNLTPSGSSHVQTPLVEGDFVYFGGKWDFYCIDIVSGEIIWTHNFYWDYQLSNFLIYNDLIITNLDNGDLIAIDKFSGEQVWVNVGLSYCCTELRIYNNRIYIGNTSLYIVDADTGELLFKFKSPYYKSGIEFNNSIAVDLINNKMYTSDYKFLYCFELPE